MFLRSPVMSSDPPPLQSTPTPNDLDGDHPFEREPSERKTQNEPEEKNNDDKPSELTSVPSLKTFVMEYTDGGGDY